MEKNVDSRLKHVKPPHHPWSCPPFIISVVADAECVTVTGTIERVSVSASMLSIISIL
jgi:hypothetical protein